MSLNIKHSGNAKLALIMAIALFLIWLVQPTLSEWLGKDKNAAVRPTPEVTQTTIESTQTATPTVPASMPGADPFKAHIEKNGLAPSPSPNPAVTFPNNAARENNALRTNSANQTGTDPFKAFLEKQKQESKDAGISPFGK
jgi:hypothetical protein